MTQPSGQVEAGQSGIAGGAAYDAFDDFDRAQGAGRVRDPHPRWAELRREGGIREIDLRALRPEAEGQPLASIVPKDLRVFAALSYEAVSQVLRDGATFSSAGYAHVIGTVMGRSILQMDEPEHSRYRDLIQRSFTRKALERWERELIGPVVHGYIDRFARRGRAELVRELTFPFPVQVIAAMMDLPEADHAVFHRRVVELISIGFDPQRAMRASRELGEYFAPIVAQRRRRPGIDLISTLAAAELDGQRLTDEEIFAFLRLLGPAGAETTYRSSSNLLFGLLTHPDQLEALRADRSRMQAAIEEGLRWEPPLTGIMRISTRDTEVCGVLIPAGSVIQVNMASANRDQTRWERPDEFDIARPARPHLSFALGPHRCLGMHLALAETRIALGALLDRLPGLRLDPAAEDVHITGESFRAPRSLPVVFDA
jgi:cytochrome P450